MVIVAIQHRIVHQFHLLLLLPAPTPSILGQLLLCILPFTQGRRVGPLDLVHEVSHEAFTETVEGGFAHGVCACLAGLFVGLEGVADGLVDGMRMRGKVFVWVFLPFDGGVHGVGLHLDVFLDLVLALVLKVLSFDL
jgi:hypothetical protein